MTDLPSTATMAATAPSSSPPKLLRKVCLFGTSANPPTGDNGHVGIVKALSALEEFDEIRVLPVYQHTFSTKRNTLVSYEHRIELCQRAFSNIPNVTVSKDEHQCFEMLAQGMSEEEKQSLRVGTAALLEMLLAQEEREGETRTATMTQFTFCLGADTFLDLTEWKWVRSHDVLRLLGGRIIALYRVGVEGERSISHDELQARVDHVNQTESAQVKLLRIETLGGVSSSLVRSCKDLEVLKNLVAPRVLEYIQEHCLYGFAT